MTLLLETDSSCSLTSSAGVSEPDELDVLGPGSKGVDGYGVGAEDGYPETEAEGIGERPRISAMAEDDLEARLFAAMCRPRNAARGL